MLVRYLDTFGPAIMNVICIVLPIVGFIIGLMKGFLDRHVRVLEGAIIIFLSLILKNPVSSLLYRFLPFFKTDYEVINVLAFEFIAYVIIAIILVIVVFIISKFVNIVERIVGFVMQIGVPTAILGGIVSLAEFVFYLYVFIFVVFFFSSLSDSPIEASVADKVYRNIPILKQTFGPSLDACIEVGHIINSGENHDTITYKSMKVLLDGHYINYDNAKYLIDSDKLSFTGDDELVSKYK